MNPRDSKISSGRGIERDNRSFGYGSTHLGKEGAEASLEYVNTELLCVPAKCSLRIVEALETSNGRGQIFRILTIEENTSDAIYDGLDCASPTVGDGRPAGGGYLERGHAEVLFPGKDEGAATGSVVLDFGI